MYVKKIFKQSLLYGLGSSFASLVSFLILPVYTRLLSVQDFGKLSLILAAIYLFQYVYNLGIYSGFMIRYFDFTDNQRLERRRLSSTILFSYLFVCLTASLVIYVFFGSWLSVFIGDSNKLVVTFIVLISSFEVLYVLPTVIMRLEERIISFITISLLKSIMLWVAVFFALKYTKGLLNAALAAQLAVTLLSAALAYMFTIRNYGFIFNWEEVKKCFGVGFPFLIVMLSFWAMDSAGKFMVKYFLTLTDVALYSIAFKIGSCVLLVVTVFQLVWQPMMFRISAEEKAGQIYARIFNYFALALFAIALAVSLFSRKLILMFSTESYVSSSSLVPFIVFAYAFYGLFYYLQTPLILKKRVTTLMLICVGGTFFNLIANFTAIRIFGIAGAAYAIFITYIAMSCVVLLASQKAFRISYDMGKLIKVSGVVLLIFLIGRMDAARGFLNVLFEPVLMLFFFIFLALIGYFDDSDIFYLKKKLKLVRRIEA